ncbi:hypothetical protein CULT_130018 [[Clostridium] ultunense Esp]|nr:hypothetical protein CULT_130018 [[Clostridium] ultunense Esp]
MLTVTLERSIRRHESCVERVDFLRSSLDPGGVHLAVLGEMAPFREAPGRYCHRKGKFSLLFPAGDLDLD